MSETDKPISPKKIREMANLLKMTPTRLIICLDKKKDHPDSIIMRSVMNEFENSESEFSKKINKLETCLKKENTKNLIDKITPLLNKTELLFFSGFGLLFAICLFTGLVERFEKSLGITIVQVSFSFFLILLAILIVALAWLFLNAIHNAIKPKISPERYAIEEIVKIIKLIDDDFRD